MANDENYLPFMAGMDLAHPEMSFDQHTDSKLLEWIETVTEDWPEAAGDLRNTLGDNPGRISRAYRSLLAGYSMHPREILKITIETPHDGHHGLVSSDKIPFLAFCAHHFLPFFGQVDIVYEPGTYIIGIGKMPRLVNCRAKRFQLQELLVKQIAEDMMQHAQAKGVYVRSAAHHMCVCYRGPDFATVKNVTTYALGTLEQPGRETEIVAAMSAAAGD
ncbi:MAG TPA: GTP cyclohydrolase I [Candidatus Angelobacter sp.]|nr:GTP cyclohydrolase I [Candidatus Angelobacter sp.]